MNNEILAINNNKNEQSPLKKREEEPFKIIKIWENKDLRNLDDEVKN